MSSLPFEQELASTKEILSDLEAALTSANEQVRVKDDDLKALQEGIDAAQKERDSALNELQAREQAQQQQENDELSKAREELAQLGQRFQESQAKQAAIQGAPRCSHRGERSAHREQPGPARRT